MKSAIVFGMIGLGFLMLALSFAWVKVFSGGSGWTKEKAQHWSEVKDRLSNLSFVVNAPPGARKMHSGPDPAEAKAEYDKLFKEHEELAAEFTGGYNAPRTMATVLRWGGISLAVVGLVGWYAIQNSN